MCSWKRRELTLLAPRHVPAARQPQVARLHQPVVPLLPQLPVFRPADLMDRRAQVLRHVELVEGDQGLGVLSHLPDAGRHMSIATISIGAQPSSPTASKYPSMAARSRPSATYSTRGSDAVRSLTTVTYSCRRWNDVSSTPTTGDGLRLPGSVRKIRVLG